MSVDLKHRIQEDMKAAMRSKDSLRLTTLRMLIAAIKQREIDEKITLDNSQVIKVINKMIKQRHDAAEQFANAARDELAEKERQEIAILKHYLPEPLTAEAIEAAVKKAIMDSGAHSLKEMGKVMALLKSQLEEGRADMRLLSEKIKELLKP